MYKWRGRPKNMRDQVDTILDIVQKGASLVSVGMNLAPVYVSLPWTAITILLPVSIDLFNVHSWNMGLLDSNPTLHSTTFIGSWNTDKGSTFPFRANPHFHLICRCSNVFPCSSQCIDLCTLHRTFNSPILRTPYKVSDVESSSWATIRNNTDLH